MIQEQESFLAGLDLITPTIDIPNNGYVWTINGRSRFGYIQPIPQPKEVTSYPPGIKQGILAVGNAIIAFVAGKAYYKVYGQAGYSVVPNFSMSPTATLVYSQPVPISSFNYIRNLSDATSIDNPINKQYSGRIAGMPSGIVCQDGVTQPQLIAYDEVNQVFFSRTLGTFAVWAQNNPEYVPVGKQMMYMSGKLFIVAPDGHSVYQSVSGQPLNFMMNIDPSGNKATTEALGGAATTSFAFDYDSITCIEPVNIPDSFIYATAYNTRVVQLDYTRTVFGEPLFTQAIRIDSGILNQYAVADISGDYAFAGVDGIKTFNAVQGLHFQGRNSTFSRVISKLFIGISQSYVCTFYYDNYVFFSVDTVLGPALVVYDTMNGCWAAIDMQGIGKVIQAAVIDLPIELRVYVITDTQKIYQLYSPHQPADKCSILTRAYSTSGMNNQYAASVSKVNSDIPLSEMKSQAVDLVFRGDSVGTNVELVEFVNGILKGDLIKPLQPTTPLVSPSTDILASALLEQEGERITFAFKDTPRGYKLSYLISWQSYAALMKIRLTTTDTSQVVADSQRSLTIGRKLT
jgi:hypothetical protein